MLNKEKKDLLSHITFFNDCFSIEEDFRGHSSALRYICKKNGKKYFIKIYENNRLRDIADVEKIYMKLRIPTSNVIEKEFLKEFDKTYVIYEYIDGKTLLELTCELELNDLEKIGNRVGNHLSKFQVITTDKEKLIKLYESEFDNLIDKLYYMKKKYNNVNEPLEYIDLDRICRNFNELKICLYNSKPSFIHKDINLNNVIVSNDETYFVDTDGGKVAFRALDFRGVCWWTWDGENRLAEQAIYRGIFKGLFRGNIPDDFHKELAFTIIYEFLLKIEEASRTDDMARTKYIFSKFGDIFNRTNYFENYKFNWFS